MTHEMRQLTLKEFPMLLREIPDPPKKLYIKGNLPYAKTKVLAVVGSRQYSPYGKEVCEKLIAGLRGHPIAIVSGLALGIDSIAHRAALSSGLLTIAIPGSGLDDAVLYPASHRNLAKQILDEGGALLSEFEPEERAAPYMFPQRNRIMAGMSDAVLVIEAQEKSGTLITSRLAIDYNRTVLTVPGSIYAKGSYGPHMLLRLGATPVVKSGDILEALGLEAEREVNITPEYLSENEKGVLALLDEPRTKDELVTLLALPIHEANVVLSTLEIKGLIEERLGKISSCL
jgi:DNA processing protein